MKPLIRLVAGLVVLGGCGFAGAALADDCSMFTAFADGANQRQQINDFIERESASANCTVKYAAVNFRLSVKEAELSPGWQRSAMSQLGSGICSLDEVVDAMRSRGWSVFIYFNFPDGSYVSEALQC